MWAPLCYVWDRNQVQTRVEAEIVVYSEQSREPGDQKYEVQNGRQKSSQSKRNQNQESEYQN